MDETKVYLCRCENVTLDDIHRLLEAGMVDMEEIKRECRCTKGPCQGRTCRDLIANEVARFRNIPIEEVDIPGFRSPVQPIALGDIAAVAGVKK